MHVQESGELARRSVVRCSRLDVPCSSELLRAPRGFVRVNRSVVCLFIWYILCDDDGDDHGMEIPAGTLQPSLCPCLASCHPSTLPGKSCGSHTCCCPRQSPRSPRRGRTCFVVPQLFPDGHRPAHNSHACALPLVVIPRPLVRVAILLPFWYVRMTFCPVPASGRPLSPHRR